MFFSSNNFFDLMTDCATPNFRGLQLHCVPNTSTPRATCAKASTYTKVSVDKSADKQSKRSSFRAEPRISFSEASLYYKGLLQSDRSFSGRQFRKNSNIQDTGFLSLEKQYKTNIAAAISNNGALRLFCLQKNDKNFLI